MAAVTRKESDLPLTSDNVFTTLRDKGFKVFSSWEALGRELGVPLDYRRQLRARANRDENYEEALEELIDYWLTNDVNHSWEKLVKALEKIMDEKETATNIRKKFNMPVPSDSTGIPVNPPKAITPGLEVVKSFSVIQEKLQPLLQLSINDFASKCFSRQLISAQLYEKLFNHTPSSEAERTSYLIFLIIKRVSSLEAKGEWSEAKKIINQFGEAVINTDRVLLSIGEEIKSLEDSQSLVMRLNRIRSSIQTSLSSISLKLMSCDLISDDEYDAAIDPDSSHSRRHLEEIFRTLREDIKADYQKYRTLLSVLKDMGPPISSIAESITENKGGNTTN